MRTLLLLALAFSCLNASSQISFKNPEAFFNHQVYPSIKSIFAAGIIENARRGFSSSIKREYTNLYPEDANRMAEFLQYMSLEKDTTMKLGNDTYLFYFQYNLGMENLIRTMFLLVTSSSYKELSVFLDSPFSKYGLHHISYLKPRSYLNNLLELEGVGYSSYDAECCPSYTIEVFANLDLMNSLIRLNVINRRPFDKSRWKNKYAYGPTSPGTEPSNPPSIREQALSQPGPNSDKAVSRNGSQEPENSGTANSTSYTGAPRNFGVKVLNVPAQSFEDDFNENAKIAMDIVTDVSGKVISATFQPRGSTTSNPQMVSIARRRAFELKSIGSGDGPQKGTVIFNFKAKS